MNCLFKQRSVYKIDIQEKRKLFRKINYICGLKRARFVI